jgi:hypothetical protein
VGKIIYGKFGHGNEKSAFEDVERKSLFDYVTVTATYQEHGSVTDEMIEKITGPPNHSRSGFGKRDMGWVFPKDNTNIDVLVTKLQTIAGVSIEINLTDVDGNLN